MPVSLHAVPKGNLPALSPHRTNCADLPIIAAATAIGTFLIFISSPPPLLRVIRIRAIIGTVTTMITIYKITNRLCITAKPVRCSQCETQEQANERERFWIRVLKSKMPNGYNRTNGGEGGTHKQKNTSLGKEVFVMAIGDNIKNLRLQHSLSQLELANIVDVSDKAVSTWEQNKVMPRMGVIQKIADYFGIQKSELIEDNAVVQAPVKRSVKRPMPLNKDETKLISDYRNLNGKNRQAIDVMIALFLSQQSGSDFSSHAAAV